MYDVIVIGAGPAGNIAAARLSGMGYRIAVLDWRTNIGDKLCTGIIGAECAERFPPDEAHIYHRARAAIVVSPAGKRYRVTREETQAYVIDRVAYVASLAQRAMESGSDYHLGLRVSNIEVSDREVTVSATSGAGQRRYEAAMAILASGFGSPLLSAVGLQNGGSRDHMVGCQAMVEANGVPETEVYLGQDITPGSFGWLVPLSDSRALVGNVARGNHNGHMGRFLSSLQERGKVRNVISKPRRWGIPLKPLARTYGHRVMVVGDAAGLVKPTSGGGIYYSLLSGEIAADTANEAFIAGDLSARQLRRYEKEWKAFLGRELRIGYAARKLYETLGDRQIESLLNRFLSAEVGDELINSRDLSFDWHSGLILKAVRHRELGRLIGSFGPIVAPLLSMLLSTRPAHRNYGD